VQREAGPGNGSADGRRQAADRRQETGGRQVAGGSLWHSTQALLRGVRRAPGCIVWLSVCLHLSTYTLCPRGRRTQAARHRQQQAEAAPTAHVTGAGRSISRLVVLSAIMLYTTYVDRRSRRSRACRGVGGAGADVDAGADVFMAPSPPLARAMLELEHCHGGASPPSQPAIPASILIRFAHRQLTPSQESRAMRGTRLRWPSAVCGIRQPGIG
jgi:hypothetical protein